MEPVEWTPDGWPRPPLGAKRGDPFPAPRGIAQRPMIELSDDFRETYFAESHGSLQTNDTILTDLLGRLTTMNLPPKLLGNFKDLDFVGPASISLAVEDTYRAAEEIEMRARVENFNVLPMSLSAHITPVGDAAAAAPPSIDAPFQKTKDGWQLKLRPLPPHLYRVEVRTGSASPNAPTPVHNLFEVVPIV